VFAYLGLYSVLVSTCFSAISFLTICFLHQFQLLGTEPKDLVSIGIALKDQEKCMAFQLQENWQGNMILVGGWFGRNRSYLRSVLYLLCPLAL
jgi:hypothetical protein